MTVRDNIDVIVVGVTPTFVMNQPLCRIWLRIPGISSDDLQLRIGSGKPYGTVNMDYSIPGMYCILSTSRTLTPRELVLDVMGCLDRYGLDEDFNWADAHEKSRRIFAREIADCCAAAHRMMVLRAIIDDGGSDEPLREFRVESPMILQFEQEGMEVRLWLGDGYMLKSRTNLKVSRHAWDAAVSDFITRTSTPAPGWWDAR